MIRRRTLLAAVVVLLVATAAHGQFDQPGAVQSRELQRDRYLADLQQIQNEDRLRANEDIPAGQRMLVDYGAYLTFDYFSIDDRADNNHGLRQYDLVAYGRVNLDGANEVFARGRTSYLDFNNGDNFSGTAPYVKPQLERGYYRFDLSKYDAAYKGKTDKGNFTFQAGRDLVYWANGLVMGEVIDGGIINFDYGKLDLQVVAGITSPQTVDIDTSRPEFDVNTRRGFYGAKLTADLGKHHPFVYSLFEMDYNSQDFRQIGAFKTEYDYNARYLGAGSSGNLTDHLLYGAEFVWEYGNTLSNSFIRGPVSLEPVTQTRNDIMAYGGDIRLDYLVPDQAKTRLSGEVIFASGDHNRGTSTNTFNGSSPNTKDRGFNAFGLINSGLAFAPQVSNLLAFRIGAATFPMPEGKLKRLQIGTDFFIFDKLEQGAPISEPSLNKPYLGVEPDLYLNWQITSDITLAMRYGIFLPSHTLLSHDQPRQFFYTGVTFAF